MRIENGVQTNNIDVSEFKTAEVKAKTVKEETVTKTLVDDKKKSEKNEENVDLILKKLNESADAKSNGIRFEKDDDSKRVVVKVFNEKTGEVIRQIPSKEFLTIAKNLETALGNIFNKEV